MFNSIYQKQFIIFIVFKSSHIKWFIIIKYYKWHYIISQTFSKHNHTSYSAIAIAKGMNKFKLIMKIYNIFYSNILYFFIF